MASSDESMSVASPQDFPTSPSSDDSLYPSFDDSPSTSSDESMSDASDSLFQAFLENFPLPSLEEGAVPIMVNACTGKMGKAVIEEALSHELFVIPVSFGSEAMSGQTYDICKKKFYVQGPFNRETVLEHLLAKYPNMIVVDFTVPTAVNANVDLYCKFGVPFVMGTQGGNRELMKKTILNSESYALVSPQIGKQAIAFLGNLDIMANRFPGIFAGYSLQSLDESKVQSHTIVKSALLCFNKMGVPANTNQVQLFKDPILQQEVVGIDEEHLSCHDYQEFDLTSPDKMAHFEFQLYVGGRSMYAESTIDAVKFLGKKIKERDGKKLYKIIDVLKAGCIE